MAIDISAHHAPQPDTMVLRCGGCGEIASASLDEHDYGARVATFISKHERCDALASLGSLMRSTATSSRRS